MRHTFVRHITPVAFAATTLLVGCTSQQETVDKMQPQAIESAQKRGSFDLNCPAAKAEVNSKEMVQPPGGPRYVAPERAEYTIGVEGCGKRQTYLVVCASGGTGCVAGTGREAAAR